MINIIKDLGGILGPEDEQPKNNKHDSKIEIYPSTYNKIPSDLKQNWTIYLQFDEDTPIPFAFVPNGDEMRIRFFEPNDLLPGEKSPAIVFTDARTNKQLRLFAKK